MGKKEIIKSLINKHKEDGKNMSSVGSLPSKEKIGKSLNFENILEKVKSAPGKAIDNFLSKTEKGAQEKRDKIRKNNVPPHMLRDYDAGTLPKLPDLSLGGAIKSIKDKVLKKKSK